jgi:hypothetical protein
MTNARRGVGLVATVCALFIAPTTASAAKNHSVNVTAQLAQVQPGPNPVTAGPLTGFGANGVLITRGRITGITLKGTLRAYNTAGSATATFSVVITVAPDGSATFAGTATVTGGTGRYQGATGRLTIDGSSPALGAVATFHARGTLKY